MSLLQLLQKINPNFKEFVTQPICDDQGITLGTKCFGVEKDSNVFSGGTALQKEVAIRIAIAEAFERSYFWQIYNDQALALEFDIASFPSSSGFAVGFDEPSTRFRAICEGLERWVWSKWIDEHFVIERHVPHSSSLGALTRHLKKSFNETYWFKKDFVLNISSTEKMNLSIVIFIGCNENGVFPGSRVSTSSDDLYQHPVIEAHRNLSNVLLDQKNPQVPQDIIQARTLFFGRNKKLALEQVSKAYKTDWPEPELHLLKKFNSHSDEVFMYRCLLKDFIGWHLGPVERFVY